MDTLANEVLIQVFALSETVELGRLMRCSRRFHQLITDDYMWKEAFRKRWGDGYSAPVSSTWRNEYCKRSNELYFWKDCRLKGKSLFLKNWIPDRLLDISYQQSSNSLRVLSPSGFHSFRLSIDSKESAMERHSSYFPRSLVANCAQFYNGYLVVGMDDGDLYVIEEASKESFDLKEQGRRFNSSLIRMAVQSIDLITDETLLVSYQNEDKKGYFQLALWKFKGQRRWLWHLGEQDIIDWCWMKREEEEELIVLLAQERSVNYYQFDLSAIDSSPSVDTPANLQFFAPLAKAKHSWTFNDSVIEQVSFASREHFLVRTQKSLEIFKLNKSTDFNHETSLLVKCSQLWTSKSIGMALLASSEGLSLFNCHTRRFLQLPLPSGLALPLQDALVGSSVCLALAQYSITAFDVLNGELLSHRRLHGINHSSTTDSYHLTPFSTDFHQLCLYNGAGKLRLLSFIADDDDGNEGSKQSFKPTPEPKKSPVNPASALLRQEIADWKSEHQEEQALDALRDKFNLNEMSEEQMLKLAISLSGGQLQESASGSDVDTDLEIALRLSLREN